MIGSCKQTSRKMRRGFKSPKGTWGSQQQTWGSGQGPSIVHNVIPSHTHHTLTPIQEIKKTDAKQKAQARRLKEMRQQLDQHVKTWVIDPLVYWSVSFLMHLLLLILWCDHNIGAKYYNETKVSSTPRLSICKMNRWICRRNWRLKQHAQYIKAIKSKRLKYRLRLVDPNRTLKLL